MAKPVRKRGLGGLGTAPSAKSAPSGARSDYWWRFFNPFSTPPGSPAEGPTLREVIVPPAGDSPVSPPGLLEFLNPFSPPPGAGPVSYRQDRNVTSDPYRNLLPPPKPQLGQPWVPEGWVPPGMRLQPSTLSPDLRYRLPLRRRKPKKPKPRESEA